jgi:hypothetical protein
LRIVNVKTDDFEAEALSIEEMPWQHVMTAAIADPYHKRIALIDMLKSAIFDDYKRKELETLSYRQVMDALDAYTTAKPYNYDPWEGL